MTTHTLAAALGGALGGMLHHHPRPACPASGWGLHHSCADHGQAICPMCTHPVRVAAHSTHAGVVVIGEHR